jgi:hypothetical protein
MFKNRFADPPGDNVRDITNEGLRRWPNAPRLLDVRARAADELVSQAIGQRSSGDVTEALRLARIAQDLDTNDAAAKRLVEQYESEVAALSATPAAPLPKGPGPTGVTSGRSVSSASAVTPNAGYKVTLDASVPSPRAGQTVDFVAHVAPAKGAFDEPMFVIAGPGVVGGVKIPAQVGANGTFKATFTFAEVGKFEVVFTTQNEGKPIRAQRSVTVGDGGRPGTAARPAASAPSAPASSPTPPAPTASVKWM